MIRPININLNAAHPELPLVEATTFTGAPSSVFIRGVPKAVGNWSITAVTVAVTYPDNTTTARAAVESAGGVWVATIPGTATSGRTAAGFKIMADGIDENGDAVTGYVLGFSDFSVLSFTPVPAPGGTFYLLRYFDQAPATPKEGDVAKIDGVLKFYNGSAWEPFAAPVTLDDTVTPSSANGVKSSGIWSAIWGALSALPAGFTSLYDWCVSQLAGKASTADATLTNTAWKVYREGVDVTAQVEALPRYNGNNEWSVWDVHIPSDPPGAGYASGAEDATSLSWGGLDSHDDNINYTATRYGYQLGSQTDKPLASEAEAEALRTGKQDALSQTQLANIAAVSDALAFDATHSYAAGDPVVYNGTLYTFAAAHTGAWTGSDVSAVDIIEMLAGKLGNSGNQTLDGSLTLLGIALTNGVILYNGSTFILPPWIGGTLALMEHIAPGFSAQSSYEVGQLVVQNFILKKCTTAGTGSAAVFASATVEDVLAALRTAIAGKADASAIPYDLGAPTVIDTASSETVEGETVNYGEATLADRTSNIVQVTAATALDELRITFPAATSGKVRDFGLRVEIGTGSAALSAPALVPIAPTGETIKIENADGTIPELADGMATAKGVTLLYFSETAPGVFVVKGEQVEEVA